MLLPPAPLFRDPVYDGAADPTIIWNHEEKCWWLLYTNRRASVETAGFAWVHGSDIGVASTKDNGQSWYYRGILEGLNFERGRNTFWAPEVLWHDGLYHMYVSYIRGVPHTWHGHNRQIVHMTSKNLWDWQKESILTLSSEYVIDACVFQCPNGQWRMWYKDEANASFTYMAESDDLYHWKVCGPVITDCCHEGPNVFEWRGSYWMITDPWCGLGVYQSDDLDSWTRRANILDKPGTRNDDMAKGSHADVLVQGDDAYVFYFTHPEIRAGEPHPDEIGWSYNLKRTSLQVAKLETEPLPGGGNNIVCNRDEPFHFELMPGMDVNGI